MDIGATRRETRRKIFPRTDPYAISLMVINDPSWSDVDLGSDHPTHFPTGCSAAQPGDWAASSSTAQGGSGLTVV